MNSYLASAIQMTSVPDLASNLAQAEELIDVAVRKGAQLVGLPENFSFMGEEKDKLAQAEVIGKETQIFLKKMAQRYQVNIIGGGFPVPSDNIDKVYNTAVLIDSNGEELSCYRKAHLFDVNVPDGNTYQKSNTIITNKELPNVYLSIHL